MKDASSEEDASQPALAPTCNQPPDASPTFRFRDFAFHDSFV